MAKNIKLTCLFIFFIILLMSLSPAVYSKSIKDNNTRNSIIIRLGQKENNLKLSNEEIKDVKEILTLLHEAIQTNDLDTIYKCESKLYDYGILDKTNKNYFSKQNYDSILAKTKDSIFFEEMDKIFSKSMDESIENFFCFTNIIGKGTVSAIGIPLLLLCGALLVSGLIFFLLPVLIVLFMPSRFVPFRAFLPIAEITIDKGKISLMGGTSGTNFIEVDGFRRLALAGFSGISIFILAEGNRGFIFYSGFSMYAVV